MRIISPYATLALLLIAAAAIFLGGQHLARRTDQVRVPGDRAAVHTVAADFDRELVRMETLYESHLRELTSLGPLRSPNQQTIWQRCDSIVGVTQWSRIWGLPTPDAPDIHIPIDARNTGQLTEPAFHLDGTELPHPRVLLPESPMLDPKGPTSGWIDEPGKPLMFWQSRQYFSVVVLSIDPNEVRTVLEPWMQTWSAKAFAPLQAAHTPYALLGPDDRHITTIGPRQFAEPDFILPIPSRFGTWQLAAWDPVLTRIRYDAPTVAVSASLAILVALLGFVGFIQQRRTLALAAQRVSFVNRVSHELRTPLTNIMLNLDLAAEEMDDDANEPRRRFDLVREESRRLGRLIENVLMFSSSNERRTNAEQLKACIPRSVIAAVVDQFAPSFARRGFTVQLNGDSSALCLLDADALAQILANLLSNVEKYAPGGLVTVSSILAQGTLSITVTDQGPGIARENAARIFRPFERLDSRINEGTTGTGLGLAIARDLAENAGGSLTLIPSQHGASFQLIMPAPPAPDLKAIPAA